ncbi:Exodeoxyribonuclease VII small subunit [Tissierella praeacuta DSM 18095]|uniref:Exodeoxyribonuclease 7 small subunit n=1 Tax=Tissierella praeacuta DSM 18095 TaxID=1123404 RepID=A0A1M4SDG7_9FIRM|nr:exodeoxyribonuclease VII small subunit [Tissierella praeacuta]TCU72775.1 exodeoxyribonuclease VII small subunit [Tissierella praeacuta]SHE30218.1 Exodeoxyribonuclease VII small subunit [Tissierella praeacuta DSM 18095]SUP01309.1 Exodeoxyribonuclease 7 small subunit [Tissierella praeacuta]
MKNKKLTYEEAISQLEGILKELESYDCTLDESMDKFKKGIELYNYCNELLSEKEGEIKILLKDNNEEMTEMDFPVEV